MKGAVVNMTENGDVLPRGTPTFVVRTTGPVTISSLSGIAFGASRGAAYRETSQGNNAIRFQFILKTGGNFF